MDWLGGRGIGGSCVFCRSALVVIKQSRFTVAALLPLWLAACSSQPVIPVKDLSTQRQSVEIVRIINPGDTLYSIAWGAGLDYRQLAQWNALDAPYILTPGRKLYLVDTGLRLRPARQSRKTTGKTGSKPSVPSAKAVTAKSKSTKPGPGRSTTTSAAKKKSTPAPTRGNWSWPVAGKTLRSFAPAKGLQGIDIAVPPGSAVKASANGRVVYAGSGLRGYGQLLIIKHSDAYLSAYGHNRKLLVEEGDAILKGQTIAESGTAPGLGNLLHFEIRKNGKPVNPGHYLPSRG